MRVLIANRAEIAIRVARTVQRLGHTACGVYSATDAGAAHVAAMDCARRLDGGYLDAAEVLDAATSMGCDAVHPGYGFLAEDATFAQAVIDAGLCWIGPSPDAMRRLGNKLAALEVAHAAGVPTAGSRRYDPENLPDAADFPVLIKAAAGGGGRGMRVVTSVDGLADEVASARREADAAFGDGDVFLERYLEGARHVEVQIFGDSHGTVVHLGERDCSVQRRHQKIIEECPAPDLSDDVRNRLHRAAVALGQEVGYVGAGTVEFLVGRDGAVAFLEVNTRLQVEHPVTECVFGVDLVEWQLTVATGGALPLRQDDLVPRGHAVEVRVVAERPADGWIPATGTLHRWFVPHDVAFARSTGAYVRLDAGVRRGDEITTSYDSMLAKVIGVGPDRRTALAMAERSLRACDVVGVATNIDMAVTTLRSDAFSAADLSTSFLDVHDVSHTPAADADVRRICLWAAAAELDGEARAADHLWGFVPSGWRNLRTRGARRRWTDAFDGSPQWTEHQWTAPDEARLLVGPWPEPDAAGALGNDDRMEVRARVVHRDGRLRSVEVDGLSVTVATTTVKVGDDIVVHVSTPMGSAEFVAVSEFTEVDAQLASGGTLAPLPGTIISVEVHGGQTVTEGDVLVVLEAMKMEHRIVAAGDATVAEVFVEAGQSVDVGDVLVRLDAGRGDE